MEKKRCVCEIQDALRCMAKAYKTIPLLTSDGIYGRETKEAVKAFQKLEGLYITGEVDHETWQAILKEAKRAKEYLNEPFQIVPVKDENLPLKENDENNLVGFLKKMLSSALLDYKRLNTSIIYDTDTKNAVKEWQRVCRMKETGICDKFTWNRLSEYYLLVFNEK